MVIYRFSMSDVVRNGEKYESTDGKERVQNSLFLINPKYLSTSNAGTDPNARNFSINFNKKKAQTGS